jgi:Putative DNA-binding domain
LLFVERPITAEHVRRFCATFHEGQRVEYKATFDDNVRGKIAKVVCSFANSQGGVLIIGVNAPNGDPEAQLQGFEAPEREEIALTVENICLRSINPPILPKTTVVRSDVPGRVFAVIEVDESAQAPHAIENSTKVFVRTGSAANPYALAEVDLIIDLVKRRRSALELRNKLVADAKSRWSDDRNLALPCMEISFCPTYPRSALCTSVDVWDFLVGVHTIRQPNMAVLIPPNSLRRVPDGAGSVSSHQDTQTSQYLEVSRYGLVFAARPFGKRPWLNPQNPVRQLIFGDLLHTLMLSAICANRLLAGKYQGDVLVNASLHTISNEVMLFRDADPHFPFDEAPDDFRSHAEAVSATRIVSTEQLTARRSELVVSLLTEITWAFWQGFEEHPTAALGAYVAERFR